MAVKQRTKTVMIPFPKEPFPLQDQRNLLEFLALKPRSLRPEEPRLYFKV
jgi:hypothetical protein